MLIADLVRGHEWPSQRDCPLPGWDARREQHSAAKRAHLSLSQAFTAYGASLERVNAFKYLGRLLAYNDNDAQAVHGNLKKERGVWSKLSRTIRTENASPRVCGIFYQATAQSILLFGSQTWNSSPSSFTSGPPGIWQARGQ